MDAWAILGTVEPFPPAGGVPRVGSFRKLGIALTPGPLPGSESLFGRRVAVRCRGWRPGALCACLDTSWPVMPRARPAGRGVSGSLPWPVDPGLSIVVRARPHGAHLAIREPLSSDAKTGTVWVAGIANGSIGGKAIEPRH